MFPASVVGQQRHTAIAQKGQLAQVADFVKMPHGLPMCHALFLPTTKWNVNSPAALAKPVALCAFAPWREIKTISCVDIGDAAGVVQQLLVFPAAVPSADSSNQDIHEPCSHKQRYRANFWACCPDQEICQFSQIVPRKCGVPPHCRGRDGDSALASEDSSGEKGIGHLRKIAGHKDTAVANRHYRRALHRSSARTGVKNRWFFDTSGKGDDLAGRG